MDINKIKEKIKTYLPWIVLGIVVIALIGIGIKIYNSMPNYNPYNMEINRLESKLIIEKRKTDSIDKKAKEWEKLYLEESLKPKKIIIRTNEKLDSIKHLSLDSSISLFQCWTKQPVDRIPE
jgi:hypothetical protein